jgi:hypothetical protein
VKYQEKERLIPTALNLYLAFIATDKLMPTAYISFKYSEQTKIMIFFIAILKYNKRMTQAMKFPVGNNLSVVLAWF